MPTSTNVTNLKINTLTKAQYDAAVQGGVIGPNELSIITDLDESIQVTTMPTASAGELGKIYQFVGTTGATYTNGYFYKCVSDGQTPATYSWEQINVQPAGSSGGGIDWKTTVDLPVNNSYGVPIYTISGGLPDGNYEFYWQIKTTSDAVDAYPLGVVTFKGLLKVINGAVNGKFGFVLDGNYIPGQNYIPERMEMSDWIKRTANGDWAFFYNGKPWMTEMIWYSRPTVIPECFKLSAIKNVDTGQEYIATGEIYDGSFQYDADVPSYMVCEPLAKEVQLPYYRMAYMEFNAYDSVKWKQQELICANKADAGNFDSLYLIMNCGDDVLRCTWENRDLLGCVARIEESTGIFANAEIGVDKDGNNPAVWIQFPDSTTRYFYYTVSVKAVSGGVSFSGWSQTSYSRGEFEELPLLNIGATVVPQNFGTILQYTGATNANYTNGYFYKASGTEVVVPVNGTITNVTPSGATVTIDFEELVSALMNAMGWGRNEVCGYIQQYSGYTDTWNASDNTLTLDGIALISLDTYPNVATFADYGSATQVTFAIENFQDTHTEVQNGHWEQVDVQPGSGGGLQNTATDPQSLTIQGDPTSGDGAMNIGTSTTLTGNYSVVIGKYARSSQAEYNAIVGYNSSAENPLGGQSKYNSVFGCTAQARESNGMAMGYAAVVLANGAMQFGTGANSEAGTVCFALTTTDDDTSYTNYKLLDSDGTIPTARLTKVNSTVTIAVADWNGGTTVTKTVAGITATGVVLVSPDPTDQAAYTSAGILCTAQAANSLTFTCSTTPTAAIDVNVVML